MARAVAEPDTEWTMSCTTSNAERVHIVPVGSVSVARFRVPDRDLVLTLTPDKAEALAERFERVSDVLGGKKKKARYSAVLSITSDHVAEAQQLVEKVLDEKARRWRLDEVVTHTGKPSEIYYLVKLKKPVTRDDLLTAIRGSAGEFLAMADLESRDPSDQDVRAAV